MIRNLIFCSVMVLVASFAFIVAAATSNPSGLTLYVPFYSFFWGIIFLVIAWGNSPWRMVRISYDGNRMSVKGFETSAMSYTVKIPLGRIKAWIYSREKSFLVMGLIGEVRSKKGQPPETEWYWLRLKGIRPEDLRLLLGFLGRNAPREKWDIGEFEGADIDMPPIMP